MAKGDKYAVSKIVEGDRISLSNVGLFADEVEISGDLGTITQVNGENPDINGHVTLTATDVDADHAGAAITARNQAIALALVC